METNATKPATIFAVHGAGMSGAFWGGFFPQAAMAGMNLRAPSLPGHEARIDDSPLPTIAEMGAWVKKYLAHEPAGSVVLAGHSMGALAALEAADHPSVAALVLMGAAATMRVNAKLLAAAEQDPEAAIGMILTWSLNPALPHAAPVREVLQGVMEKSAPRTLAADLRACHVYEDAALKAAGIAKPVLVIGGQDDRMTPPENGQQLAGLFPAATYAQIDDCGHMMPVEKPAQVMRLIRGLLDG